MYYLTVTSQDTQCPEDSPHEDTQYSIQGQYDNCLSQVIGESRTCKVHLLRSWVPNSSPVNAHVS